MSALTSEELERTLEFIVSLNKDGLDEVLSGLQDRENCYLDKYRMFHDNLFEQNQRYLNQLQGLMLLYSQHPEQLKLIQSAKDECRFYWDSIMTLVRDQRLLTHSKQPTLSEAA